MIEPSGIRTWRELDNKALEFLSTQGKVFVFQLLRPDPTKGVAVWPQ
jgi:hypothetical protein